MDDFSDKKTFTSLYNEAAFQINRLNNLWSLCNNYARIGNLSGWKWLLDRIWVELAADAKEKNEDKYFPGNRECNTAIGKAMTKNQLYNALQEKEIFLRCLQEAVGKGGKKREGFEEW